MSNRGNLKMVMVTNGAHSESGWSPEQKQLLVKIIKDAESLTIKPGDHSEVVQAYSDLLKDTQLSVHSLYHLRSLDRRRNPHEFVTVLDDPTEEGLRKVYRLQLELQRQYPVDSLDFDIMNSQHFADIERARLEEQGFRLYEDR